MLSAEASTRSIPVKISVTLLFPSRIRSAIMAPWVFLGNALVQALLFLTVFGAVLSAQSLLSVLPLPSHAPGLLLYVLLLVFHFPAQSDCPASWHRISQGFCVVYCNIPQHIWWRHTLNSSLDVMIWVQISLSRKSISWKDTMWLIELIGSLDHWDWKDQERVSSRSDPLGSHQQHCRPGTGHLESCLDFHSGFCLLATIYCLHLLCGSNLVL